MQPPKDDNFAERVNASRDRLYRWALRLCGNKADAEDLVQETLLRAIARRAQFEPGSHLETWLTKILTNRFFDLVKHHKVERKAEPELEATEGVQRELLVDRISDGELEAAVKALEPELREVIELCYMQRKRYREAAAILRLPSGTVATRLARARARLRDLLTKQSREP